MPSSSEIASTVIHSVSKYSGVKEAKILQTMVLANPPLMFQDIGYNALTLSLRGYIQFSKIDNTILLKEVKKPGQTVKDLIELVTTRV